MTPFHANATSADLTPHSQTAISVLTRRFLGLSFGRRLKLPSRVLDLRLRAATAKAAVEL